MSLIEEVGVAWNARQEIWRNLHSGKNHTVHYVYADITNPDHPLFPSFSVRDCNPKELPSFYGIVISGDLPAHLVARAAVFYSKCTFLAVEYRRYSAIVIKSSLPSVRVGDQLMDVTPLYR